MKSTDRVRYNYYSIDFACVSIEFITKSQLFVLGLSFEERVGLLDV